jgi:hypothetical protein
LLVFVMKKPLEAVSTTPILTPGSGSIESPCTLKTTALASSLPAPFLRAIDQPPFNRGLSGDNWPLMGRPSIACGTMAPMPVARTPADIMCLALYTLAGGNLMRGLMVMTIAQQLGITFGQATDLAEAAHKAGLVHHVHGTVSLTAKGQERGATLTPPSLPPPKRPRRRTPRQ